MVLADWLWNFLIRIGNEEKWKILSRILQETGSLDRLCDAADDAYRAAVEELVQSQQSRPHAHTFVYHADVLNILCDLSICFLCTWWTFVFQTTKEQVNLF